MKKQIACLIGGVFPLIATAGFINEAAINPLASANGGCKAASEYRISVTEVGNSSLEDALKTVTADTPLKILFAVHGEKPTTVNPIQIDGPMDSAMNLLGREYGFDWQQRDCKILVTKTPTSNQNQHAIMPGMVSQNSQTSQLQKPVTISDLPIARTQASGVIAQANTPNGTWVISPGTLYSATVAIANRYGYDIVHDKEMNEIGARMRFNETLPLSGKDIISDFETLIAAVNQRRVLIDVQIYKGNKRVVPVFHDQREQ